MPSCELCGRSMKGQGRNVIVEGASMLLCPQCASKFGQQTDSTSQRAESKPRYSPSWMGGSERQSLSEIKPRSSATPPMKVKPKPKPRKQATGILLEDLELVEDYANVIRTARQKKEMSQDELAQRVGESISTLKAIEAGRQKPTEKTIRGLERELDISLLEPLGTVPLKVSKSQSIAGPTLGDRVIVKRKKSQKARKDDT
ncbi:MAG: TIGR00270 family protein [Candidatus Thorarchaeota archaeon]|nr:TIGR00270 family protein [Candidatus Thorarchaeota archaeon]